MLLSWAQRWKKKPYGVAAVLAMLVGFQAFALPMHAVWHASQLASSSHEATVADDPSCDLCLLSHAPRDFSPLYLGPVACTDQIEILPVLPGSDPSSAVLTFAQARAPPVSLLS